MERPVGGKEPARPMAEGLRLRTEGLMLRAALRGLRAGEGGNVFALAVAPGAMPMDLCSKCGEAVEGRKAAARGFPRGWRPCSGNFWMPISALEYFMSSGVGASVISSAADHTT